MSHRYLSLVKILILLLALGIPLMLYQSFVNYRNLIRGDASLQESLALEQDQLARRVTRFFFAGEAVAGYRVLRRRLPDGAIQGLADLPAADLLRDQWGIRLAPEAILEERIRELLWDPDRFASGMPKRFAGLVEICGQPDMVLSPHDFERFYQVAGDFWCGRDLDGESYGFLLRKLPPKLGRFFSRQSELLALTPVTSPSHESFLVSLQTAEDHFLLLMPARKLADLNRLLRAFKSDTKFRIGSDWLRWDGIQLTLEAERTPLSDRFWKGGLVFLGVGLGAEIILWLIYAVLVKYEKINRTQRQLLATTSHELRTPLAVMRQFAEMLQDKAEHFPIKYQTYHRHIHRECLKMQFLVENLLSAARFEYFKVAPNCQFFELKPWLAELIDGVAGLAPEQKIRCTCPQIEVCWDAALMSQVLTNILENARIHAGTDIEVTVGVEAAAATILVRDFGTLADPSLIGRIQAFKPGGKSASGLGLGLYLSRRIVIAHGGSLTLDRADPGLTVKLVLPVAGPA